MIDGKGVHMWILIALIVLGVLGVLGVLALVVARRHTDDPPQDPDPLFIAGIAIAGSSAALIATLGAAMTPMLLAGLACIAIGARRGRAHHS